MSWATPKDVSDIEIAFPGGIIGKLLPPWDDIPEQFRQHGQSDRWCQQASTWFFWGVDLKKSTVTPRDGVDANRAFRQLQACLGSFDPKHEHKIAGVGYLMSLFFEELDIVAAKKEAR